MAVLSEKEIREMADEWGGLMLKLGVKLKRLAKLDRDIKAWLKESGSANITITGEYAVASKGKKQGDRQLAVKAFLEAALEKSDDERNGCLKVAMKEAEELLGKIEVDRIATRPTVPDIQLKLKEA